MLLEPDFFDGLADGAAAEPAQKAVDLSPLGRRQLTNLMRGAPEVATKSRRTKKLWAAFCAMSWQQQED
eukprot:5788995-Lingulodinium_polyedra.AAC.1